MRAPTGSTSRYAAKKIDEPSKEKTFKRCKAYYQRWDSEPWEIVEVTSLDDHGAAWIVRQGGREKSRSSLYPVNDRNDVIMKEVYRLNFEIKGVENRRDKLIEKLTRLI